MAKISVGDIYETNNSGKLRVTGYINASNVNVIFDDTGFETTVESVSIKRGKVKDKLKPSLYGVGIIGDGIYNSKDDVVAYSRWSSMIKRCYSDIFHDKNKTYKDCEVYEEWQDFQNFAEWFYNNKKDPIDEYDLDKDLIIKGNKIYSPDACSFISKATNRADGNKSKDGFLFESPNGDTVKIYNLSEFCRDNDLSDSHMNNVHSGKRKSHKGWKLPVTVKRPE